MDTSLFAAAERGVQAALDAGAGYADARVVWRRQRAVSARNGHLESLDDQDALGIGVRALIGSSWGFSATNDLTDAAVGDAGHRATLTARASRE